MPDTANPTILIALLIAAGYPIVALAEFAGLPVPTSFTPEYMLGLFVTALIGLTLFSDYSRRTRNLGVSRAPVIVPPAGAFAAKPAAKCECVAA